MRLIAVEDRTSGLFTPTQIFNVCWSLNWQALYHFNRSPWAEHGYCEPCEAVQLLPNGATPPPSAWRVELLDTSDQEGALGYHEDEAFKSSAHSTRGLVAGAEIPLAKVFVKTARESGVEPSEVASHEILEMLVDPWVVNEVQIRKYLNTAAKEWYIGEVGDPVQGEGYGIVPNVPEAVVANFAWPAWWGLGQTRPAFDQRDTRKAPFELAPGGYMSVQPEAGGEWSQIYGSDKAKAEANAHAYEGAK